MVVDIRFKKGFLYYIYCKTTEKRYVGSSIDKEEGRWRNHKYDCFKKNKKGEYRNNCTLYKHMREFGIENFELIKIEDWPCDNRKQLEMKETYWQVQYDTVKNGLNEFYAIRLKAYPEEIEKVKKLMKKNIKYKLKKTVYQLRNKEIRNKLRRDNYENRKNYFQQKQKEKYKKNKEKYLEKAKEKKQCICGIEYTIYHKSRHEKSQRHLKYLENQNKI